jgi:hypothetical protein
MFVRASDVRLVLAQHPFVANWFAVPFEGGLAAIVIKHFCDQQNSEIGLWKRTTMLEDGGETVI